MSGRIETRFAALKAEGRAGLVTYLCAGDPDLATSAAILDALPGAGADIVEIGMPFSDPMADGPSIQAAATRAIAAGTTLPKVLALVARFRSAHPDTPIVLMGYFNPVYSYGPERFLDDAKAAGVDGLIMVDLPPEEDAELCLPALRRDLRFIRLATPTTDERRLPKVLSNAGGFIYYVSITGITGAAAPLAEQVAQAVTRLRAHTALPIAVGFGIRSPQQAAEIARAADAAVVGSALVEIVARHGRDPAVVDAVTGRVRALAAAIREARS